MARQGQQIFLTIGFLGWDFWGAEIFLTIGFLGLVM
jgi:hypothetical protein